VKNKKIKRLWINSLEVEEVRKGFNSLLDNSKDLLMYEEAKARQISDWLVGMNASQLYSLLMHEKGVNMTLSVGRVLLSHLSAPKGNRTVCFETIF